MEHANLSRWKGIYCSGILQSVPRREHPPMQTCIVCYRKCAQVELEMIEWDRWARSRVGKRVRRTSHRVVRDTNLRSQSRPTPLQDDLLFRPWLSPFAGYTISSSRPLSTLALLYPLPRPSSCRTYPSMFPAGVLSHAWTSAKRHDLGSEVARRVYHITPFSRFRTRLGLIPDESEGILLGRRYLRHG